MKIDKLRIYRLRIPFSLAISHNLADRRESEAIIVIADSDTGLTGIGEGTPRKYVTKETLPGCINAAMKMGEKLVGRNWSDMDDLNQILDTVSAQTNAKQNPSAWCALELACLDLAARDRQVPLWNLFIEKPRNDTLIYSAVIPLLHGPALDTLLTTINEMDMRFVKVKIADFHKGISYLEYIRERLGPNVDIRIDANGAFSPQEALEFEQSATAGNISSFEQPVSGEDRDGLREVTQRGRVPIIADESICNRNDMDNLIQTRGCSGFNIRLSKCGGLRQSVTLWNHALDNGFFCQLGCHVGETGILDAAGEGGYTNFVLESDICRENHRFGHQGKAGLLHDIGLGVTLDGAALSRWGELAGVIS